MKKICFFFSLLLSACVVLAGCGSQAAPNSPSNFFPEDAQKVTVTHWLSGQETVSTLEGKELEPLREWAGSLSLEEKVTFPEGQAPGQTEEGGELFFFDFDGTNSSFSYRDFGSCYLVMDDRWYPVSNPSAPPVKDSEKEQALTALRPMLMVDGQLYYSAGQESSLDGRCGVMDGEITSTVDGSEIPAQNDQSNFGVGFWLSDYRKRLPGGSHARWRGRFPVDRFQNSNLRGTIHSATEIAYKKPSSSHRMVFFCC